MNFSGEYKKIKSVVDNDIKHTEKYIYHSIDLTNQYDVILKELLSAPSKRIRPVTAFLYLRANNAVIDEKQYKLQAAVELIHNASLIHDDVIDKSSLRRGRETINKQYGNKTAVLLGDYILSSALKLLAELSSSEILEIFSLTLKNMCTGELSQLLNKNKITSIEEYLIKTEQKTASLFEASLKCGAILSNMNSQTAYMFAQLFGTAFQIRDDLINVQNTDNTKPSKNDIKEGIYNAPVIFAGGTEDITSGIEKTRLLLDNYIEQAQKLIYLFPTNRYKTALTELLELLKHD